MKFTHLSSKFTHPPKQLEFNIFISIDHFYWNSRCFIVDKISPDYAFLVCKILSLKIRSCKTFDKFQVCLSNALPLKDLIFDGEGVTDLGSASPPMPDQIRKVVFDRFPDMSPGQL